MKLLLVEDDRDLGSALLRSLARAGVDVVWAESLDRARQQLALCHFHCIALDINLPDGEGFALLKSLRERQQPIPILVMTARAALDDRLRALNGGADDYVVKPFATEELIARLHALVRRASGFAAPLWPVGDLLIDSLEQRVQVAGTAVQLTPREFAVLRELALAGGRVVTREVLVDRVWGWDEAPSDGAIEYQLHGLRRKIGAERVRTLRGVGYALVKNG
jgi:DNA-binding response OmpR family regulator